MEKIMVILVCIAMVVGLLGGGVLGYFISLPEIQSLQDEVRAVSAEFNSLSSTVISMGNAIMSLNSTLETQENRSWHKVYSIEASEDITSDTFHMKGRSIRASYLSVGLGTTSEIAIYLYFTNGTMYAVWGSSGAFNAHDAEVEILESGDYYLEIYAANLLFYIVTIYDYY